MNPVKTSEENQNILKEPERNKRKIRLSFTSTDQNVQLASESILNTRSCPKLELPRCATLSLNCSPLSTFSSHPSTEPPSLSITGKPIQPATTEQKVQSTSESILSPFSHSQLTSPLSYSTPFSLSIVDLPPLSLDWRRSRSDHFTTDEDLTVERKKQKRSDLPISELFNTEPLSQNQAVVIAKLTTRNTVSEIQKKGISFPTIQQTAQRSSCGTAAVLMAYLTSFPKWSEQLDLIPDPFWDWYKQSELSSASTLVSKLLFLQKKPDPQWIKFNKTASEEALNDRYTEILAIDGSAAVVEMKKILKNPQDTLILAITHPELEGHWIVVNQLEDDSFLVRDPYSGRGFILNGEKLASYVLKEVETENCIYIPSI